MPSIWRHANYVTRPAPPTPSTRPRRGVTRNSSPGATSTPASRDGSSVPSSRNTPQPATGAPAGHALSIFNDKTSNEVAAEVQTIVGPSAGRVLRERERNTTPSSSRGRDGLERSGVSASGRGRRVGGSARVANKGAQQQNNSGKGKGKAAPASEHFVNQDFCSVCRGIGRFLCCDGCPRSFHFMCLEPPLRIDELPKEEVWYCRKCKADRVSRSGPWMPSASGHWVGNVSAVRQAVDVCCGDSHADPHRPTLERGGRLRA